MADSSSWAGLGPAASHGGGSLGAQPPAFSSIVRYYFPYVIILLIYPAQHFASDNIVTDSVLLFQQSSTISHCARAAGTPMKNSQSTSHYDALNVATAYVYSLIMVVSVHLAKLILTVIKCIMYMLQYYYVNIVCCFHCYLYLFACKFFLHFAVLHVLPL